MISRRSVSECSGSSKIRARGSANYRNCLLKRNTVLYLICFGFLGIPFKLQRHPLEILSRCSSVLSHGPSENLDVHSHIQFLTELKMQACRKSSLRPPVKVTYWHSNNSNNLSQGITLLVWFTALTAPRDIRRRQVARCIERSKSLSGTRRHGRPVRSLPLQWMRSRPGDLLSSTRDNPRSRVRTPRQRQPCFRRSGRWYRKG